MSAPTLDTDIDDEANPFEDADTLLFLREYVRESLEANEINSTGNDGCGCGSADLEMEFEGVRFFISISLCEPEETEH